MPIISQQKKDKISEQILHFLFSAGPSAKFTSEIARELARDEEFIKDLLSDLKEKKIVIDISKNPKGIKYTRRLRWRLTNEAFVAYKKHQFKPNNIYNLELIKE